MSGNASVLAEHAKQITERLQGEEFSDAKFTIAQKKHMMLRSFTFITP
ncbi:MAG: hypothetical protein JRN68_06475 [Nitrososphaerota archaeon]|jgi:hypothetical protein|nr:hypothetical protein [Nitrososphaerota archaeon]